MAGTVFYKMTGSGNDFVMLDGRQTAAAAWPRERIARVCDRRLGVGGDGLVIVSPAGAARVRMEYWNSDGSPAPMCGNAALCSTRLASHLEMAPPELMTLVTGAGEMRSRCVGAQDLAELCLPAFDLPRQLDIEHRPGESAFYLATVGVPHLVVLTEDVREVDVPTRGRELRFHPALGDGGANVNFVSPPPAGDGDPWVVRTYERGIEAETLACGTGTVACAFSLEIAGLRQLPGEFQTPLGIRLAVAGTLDGRRATEAWLCGEGRRVYTGILS